VAHAEVAGVASGRMSDTTPRGDDDVVAGFDQTNDQVGGLEGESGGTADGENRSSADQDDAGGSGGLLDDLQDGDNDPYVGGATHIGSTAAGDDRGTGD